MSKPIELRDYQARAVEDLRAACNQRPLYFAPVGSGKTNVACAIIQSAVAKGKRVVFIAHMRALVYQARDRLKAHGVAAGIVMGCEDPGSGPVYVASIQTLARREIAADIAIVDEAHHAVSPSWRRVLSRYQTICGLSATPYRLSGEPLGDVFGTIVHGPSVSDLVAEELLINPRIFAPPGPNLSGVHKRGGDFVQSELEIAVSKPGLHADIYSTWQKHARGMRTLGFAVGIAHSKACAALWGERGRHIDGTTPQSEREEAVRQLEAGEIDVLWSVSLIGEGFDSPSLDCAILARPTASLALHRQQIGRVMRACPGKEGALVLDHAGNTHRHGLPTDEVEVSLEGKARRKREVAPRTCEKCFAIIDSYPCWACNFEPPVVVREIKVTDGELAEVGPDQRRATYERWVKQASDSGFKLGWAKVKYKERYSVWPRFKDIDALYQCKGHEYEQRQYGVVCRRCLRAKHSERDPESPSEAPTPPVASEQRQVPGRLQPVRSVQAEIPLDFGGTGWGSGPQWDPG